MACGSVAQADGRRALNLACANLVQREPLPDVAFRTNTLSDSGSRVHEAIAFLQKEHENVLTGLHKHVKSLQNKCEDLQFELHLKHVTSEGEEGLKKKVNELQKSLEEKSFQIDYCNRRFEEQERIHDTEREQWQWKDLNLRQQIEVANERSSELKYEVSQLRGQVQNLKSFNAAVMKSSNGSHSPLNASTSTFRSLSSMSKVAPLHRTSQESLDSFGPRSLGSEDGEPWRDGRLWMGLHKMSLKKSRVQNSSKSSLPPLYPLPKPSRSVSSTSDVLSLPPIVQTQKAMQSKGKSRDLVRRQLRLFSAPALESYSQHNFNY